MKFRIVLSMTLFVTLFVNLSLLGMETGLVEEEDGAYEAARKVLNEKGIVLVPITTRQLSPQEERARVIDAARRAKEGERALAREEKKKNTGDVVHRSVVSQGPVTMQDPYHWETRARQEAQFRRRREIAQAALVAAGAASFGASVCVAKYCPNTNPYDKIFAGLCMSALTCCCLGCPSDC